MLLNGWKEIAEYLKSSVRTVQRWHDELRLPVKRVRNSKRGPVLAESTELDHWMNRRSIDVEADQRGIALQKRAATTGKEAVRLQSIFLSTELATGRELARLAQAARNPSAMQRRQKAARKAYDTLVRHLSRGTLLPANDEKRLKAEVEELRQELKKLGEVF